MWPATPTPFPPGEAKFELPTEYSLWGGAEFGIQVWNWTGDMGQIIQLIILIVLIAAAGFIIWRGFTQMTERDSSK